jgi:hypothetical protein
MPGGRGYPPGRGGRGHRVVLAGQDEHRAVDLA